MVLTLSGPPGSSVGVGVIVAVGVAVGEAPEQAARRMLAKPTTVASNASKRYDGCRATLPRLVPTLAEGGGLHGDAF